MTNGSAAFSAGRFLIVDDSPMLRDLAASLLTSRGHLVIEADCGARALEIMATEKFDVVLLDVEMPGELDGMQVGRAIRSNGTPLDVMIAMHTSAPKADVDAGFSDYDEFLTKPCPADEFVPKMEHLLAYRQLCELMSEFGDWPRNSYVRTFADRQLVIAAYKARLQSVIVDANALYARCKRAMGE